MDLTPNAKSLENVRSQKNPVVFGDAVYALKTEDSMNFSGMGAGS